MQEPGCSQCAEHGSHGYKQSYQGKQSARDLLAGLLIQEVPLVNYITIYLLYNTMHTCLVLLLFTHLSYSMFDTHNS